MKLQKQHLDDIVATLSQLDVPWMDEHAEDVIKALRKLPKKETYEISDIQTLLDADFDVGFTVIRLVMDQAKDAFEPNVATAMGPQKKAKGYKVSRYKEDKEFYVDILLKMGLADRLAEAVNRRSHWSDVLVERLKGGRGSAKKGQRRGRELEDFVASIAEPIFGSDQIAMRCSFTGADGRSTAKADLAIPSAQEPRIVIEAKAYGATGSKQTDVLGDAEKIIAAKRHDTYFLLVTDGITWKQRTSDLRKLIELQNVGKIHRIYTKLMAEDLEADLKALKHECGL